MSTESVLVEVAEERAAQDRRWGPPRADLADGTGLLVHRARLAVARRLERAKDPAEFTFADVLEEEVAEALVETEPDRLRAELVQVAAVAVKWVEALDARHSDRAGLRPGRRGDA